MKNLMKTLKPKEGDLSPSDPIPELEKELAPLVKIHPIKDQIRYLYVVWESAKSQDFALKQKTTLDKAILDLVALAGD